MSFDEVAKKLEKHPQSLRVKKLLFYACQRRWVNDRKILNSLNLTKYLQDLHAIYPTLDNLKTKLQGFVSNLNKSQEEYQLVVTIIVEEMARFYTSSQQTKPIFDPFPIEPQPPTSLQLPASQARKSIILDIEKFTSPATNLQRIKVTLEVAENTNNTQARMVASIPNIPHIEQHYSLWQKNYHNLELNPRLGAPSQSVNQVSSDHFLSESQKYTRILRYNLTTWYNCSEFQKIRERLIGEINSSKEVGLIVRTHSFSMWQLPWHLFFESLLTSHRHTEVAVCFPEYEQVKIPVKPKSKVRILAILGDSTEIDVEADRSLLEALPNAEIEFLVEPTRARLNDTLWEQQWDILFFAGHSSSEGEKGRLYINATESLSITELKYALTEAISQGLQLAIFNSCEGLGLAWELASLHIPQTIVMREPVPDKVAQEFLKYFLNAFSKGKSLYLAVREARERLEPFENRFPGVTWLPVICHNPTTKTIRWKELYSPSFPPPPPPPPLTLSPTITPSTGIKETVKESSTPVPSNSVEKPPTTPPSTVSQHQNSQPSVSEKREKDSSWKLLISCFKFYLKLYWLFFILFFLGQLNLPQLLMLWGILIFGCIEALVTVDSENSDFRGTKTAFKFLQKALDKQVKKLESVPNSRLPNKLKKAREAQRQINRTLRPNSSNPPFVHKFVEYKEEINSTLAQGNQRYKNIYEKKQAEEFRLKNLEIQKQNQRAKYWDKE